MFDVVYIASGIVGVIILFFVYSIIVQQKKVVAWQQARIAAEINTLEAERKRIASDLHDEIGPMLSAIKLQINHVESLSETDLIVLNKSSKQVDIIIQKFREISYDLLPNTLIRKGFVLATEEAIGRLKPLHPLHISFTAERITLSQNNEVNLYRIVQEIIQNTIKHSRATTLTISWHKTNQYYTLTTKDDGVGFNYIEKSLAQKGVGLLSLQSRAELLGSRLEVITEPGSGAVFIINIPLANAK